VSEFHEISDEREVRLLKEEALAAKTYRLCITVDNSSFFCDEYHEVTEGDRTRLTLRDAWVRDVAEPNRFVKRVEIVCRAFNVIERADPQ